MTIQGSCPRDTIRRPQVSVLGSAEPGSPAYDLAAEAGVLLARHGITLVSGCGSPATRVAAEKALGAGGLVVSIVPPDEMPPPDWPASVVIPCGMGDARNLLMALAGEACIVIAGRAGTLSEVCLAWLHRRPLLPLVGHGGWSDSLPSHPPDERRNSPILPWSSIAELEQHLHQLGHTRSSTPVSTPATPRFDAVTPRLPVRNVEQALAFYLQSLGFSLGWKWGSPPTHANVCRDDISLDLIAVPPGRQGTAMAYVHVGAVDAYHGELQARQVASSALGDRDYGMRDFEVIDPDGNRLAFGQPLS